MEQTRQGEVGGVAQLPCQAFGCVGAVGPFRPFADEPRLDLVFNKRHGVVSIIVPI
jgi:hypothetical protein